MSDSNDKRARMYAQVVDGEKNVQVTVQGAEGETTEDISERFDEKLDKVVETAAEVEDDKRGYGLE